MANLEAAHEGATTLHEDPLTEGRGAQNVWVINKRVWTVDVPVHDCKADGEEIGAAGSSSVYARGKHVMRKTDFLVGPGAPDQITSGAPTVWIGSPEVGLMATDQRKEFCKKMCQLQADWKDLDPNERRERYKQIVNDLFASFGSPPPSINFVKDGGNTLGSFNSTSWQYNVQDQYFEQPTMDRRPKYGLTGVTFHETRHGEQAYAGLRAQLARRRPPSLSDGVQMRLGGVREAEALIQPPAEVVRSARSQPLDLDSPYGRWAVAQGQSAHTIYGRAQLVWANGDYHNRYKNIPMGSDAQATDHLPPSGGPEPRDICADCC